MVPKEVLDVTAPLVDPAMWQNALSECNSISYTNKESSLETEESTKEMQLILDKINARRVVHSEYTNSSLETEPLDGYVVRLGRGKLGMAKSEPSTCLTKEADCRTVSRSLSWWWPVLFPTIKYVTVAALLVLFAAKVLF
jgi:hypothetical protein